MAGLPNVEAKFDTMSFGLRRMGHIPGGETSKIAQRLRAPFVRAYLMMASDA